MPPVLDAPSAPGHLLAGEIAYFKQECNKQKDASASGVLGKE